MYAAAPRAVLFTRLPSQWGGSERRRAAQGSRWRRTVAIESVRGCAGVWASPRAAETATLVFGRALPQIECENGDGFWRPSAFDGCPSGAEAPGVGLRKSLERVR